MSIGLQCCELFALHQTSEHLSGRHGRLLLILTFGDLAARGRVGLLVTTLTLVTAKRPTDWDAVSCG